MAEVEATPQEAPFKNLYLVRLGLGLCSAFLFLLAMLTGFGNGSAFQLLTLLGGAMFFAAYAVDPWPLSARIFSLEPKPRGPYAAWANRIELLGALLILSGLALRIFA